MSHLREFSFWALILSPPGKVLSWKCFAVGHLIYKTILPTYDPTFRILWILIFPKAPNQWGFLELLPSFFMHSIFKYLFIYFCSSWLLKTKLYLRSVLDLQKSCNYNTESCHIFYTKSLLLLTFYISIHFSQLMNQYLW